MDWVAFFLPVAATFVLFWLYVRNCHSEDSGPYCECKQCRPWRGEHKYIHVGPYQWMRNPDWRPPTASPQSPPSGERE